MNIIGIDVSKAKLDCAWFRDENKVKAKVVANRLDGWEELIKWARANTGAGISGLHFVMDDCMDAGGRAMQEQLPRPRARIMRIWQPGCMTTVQTCPSPILPLCPWVHVKHYAQSLGGRTKNDKKDSVVLARYGLKECPALWQPAPLEIRTLKALLARLSAVGKDLQREKNRQEKAAATDMPTFVLESIRQMVGHLETERETLEKFIGQPIKQHNTLKENTVLLESIPGVGKVVARQMLMVLGSHQFNSASQCAAYLGLIPVQREPCSSVKRRSQLALVPCG